MQDPALISLLRDIRDLPLSLISYNSHPIPSLRTLKNCHATHCSAHWASNSVSITRVGQKEGEESSEPDAAPGSQTAWPMPRTEPKPS